MDYKFFKQSKIRELNSTELNMAVHGGLPSAWATGKSSVLKKKEVCVCGGVESGIVVHTFNTSTREGFL